MTTLQSSAPCSTDGVLNSWEFAHGLNPNDLSDRNTTGSDGYTHLKEYLNEFGAFQG